MVLRRRVVDRDGEHGGAHLHQQNSTHQPYGAMRPGTVDQKSGQNQAKGYHDHIKRANTKKPLDPCWEKRLIHYNCILVAGTGFEPVTFGL
jgi:hypothetical protein